MIADAKMSGSASSGTGLATYMLDPEAKADTKELKGDSERVALVQVDFATPIIGKYNPNQAAKQFIQSIKDWNQCQRPSKMPPRHDWEHMVISFHPDDKKVTPIDAVNIARDALKQVAPGQRPTLFVVHGDTKHLHVHMMYATVNEQGKIHNLHRDYRHWELAMEKMEIKYGLHRVVKRKAVALTSKNSEITKLRMPDGTNPGSKEFRMETRTGRASTKKQLRHLLREVMGEVSAAPREAKFPIFITALRKRNIEISVNKQSTGRVAGIRFHYGVFRIAGIKGSTLGDGYVRVNSCRYIIPIPYS